MSVSPLAYADCFYANTTEFTTLSSFTSEASLLSGVNQQPVIPAGFFANPPATGKRLRFKAKGLVGSTGTPTYLFTCRIGDTAAVITGTAVGVTAAITTASGITNSQWSLELELTCRSPGLGAGNCTLAGAGWVVCPGFASPFTYAVQPTTPPTTTWTATINGSVQNYFQLSVTCSASDAANTIKCKDLSAESLN